MLAPRYPKKKPRSGKPGLIDGTAHWGDVAQHRYPALPNVKTRLLVAWYRSSH